MGIYLLRPNPKPINGMSHIVIGASITGNGAKVGNSFRSVRTAFASLRKARKTMNIDTGIWMLMSFAIGVIFGAVFGGLIREE